MKPIHHLSPIPALSKTLKRLSVRNASTVRAHHVKKNVTFGSDESHEVRTFVSEDIPIDDLWFSVNEFESIKEQSKSSARAWRRVGYSRLLNNVFTASARCDAGVMSSNDRQSLINAFCSLDDTMNHRGLERYCSPMLHEERSEAKTRSKYAVLDTQRQWKRNEKYGTEQMTNVIAKKYTQSCAQSQNFARQMGIGDEYAVVAHSNDERLHDVVRVCRRRLSNYSVSSAASSVSSMDSRPMTYNGIEERTLQAAWSVNSEGTSRKRMGVATQKKKKEMYASIA